ncbi:bifunctional 3'-5' exonuclease/DNA polymerase [Aquipuribacter nitratireducens]|uniref:DNA-directed DNA polymerase n=1 Tax=Aquipuribacter nitratireducens TaxID=650104 RepID=A0ABW0GQ59_9MICO
MRHVGDAVVLRMLPDGTVAAREVSDGEQTTPTVVAAAELPGLVRHLEAHRPRWVWDCTTRWYPGLLRAGVRVERCWDLRLVHALLRDSPLVDGPVDRGAEAEAWDELRPVAADDAALFDDSGPSHLDPLAEWRRQRACLDAATHGGLRLLVSAESSGALVAAELTHAGLPWRADVHDAVLTGLLGPRPPHGQRPAHLEHLAGQVRDALDAPALNPDSQPALLAALRSAGLDVADTRTHTLERLDHRVVPPLLEYKGLARLLSTNGWQWSDTWVRGGRFRPEYLVAGVVTGRWASRGGGALTVPAPVRQAVVADGGHRFVVADAAQLEPRVLAGMSGDTAMAAAARAGDLYEGMVAAGAVATRAEAKLGVLGAMYGGTRGESGRMVRRLAVRYPRAFAFVEAAARAGERGEVVRTFLGRGSPAPRAELTEEAGRAWGRFTRNFVVQGTAAEWALVWLALLRNRLWRLGDDGDRAELVMFLHDEVLVHAPERLVDETVRATREAADEATRLLFGAGPTGSDIDSPVDVPLDVRVVRSWADAQ